MLLKMLWNAQGVSKVQYSRPRRGMGARRRFGFVRSIGMTVWGRGFQAVCRADWAQWVPAFAGMTWVGAGMT